MSDRQPLEVLRWNIDETLNHHSPIINAPCMLRNV